MDEILVLLGLSSPLTVAAAVFATAWRYSRKRNKELERLLSSRVLTDDEYEELSRAIDAVRAELDTVRDDQQFLSRLLSARRTREDSEVQAE